MNAITTGTWNLDAAHSDVDFVVRHAGISKVRGTFHAVEGQLVIAEQFTQSSVDVTVDVASISTKNEGRDAHLRSADFLDVESHPAITFTSDHAEHVRGDHWQVPGTLTIRGVSQPVTLDLEFLGVQTDPWGNEKAAFEATAEVDREAFGITWNQGLEAGGVLVGKVLKVELQVQLGRQA